MHYINTLYVQMYVTTGYLLLLLLKINASLYLPSNTDISSLSAFKCSISNIDFTNYLKCYWFYELFEMLLILRTIWNATDFYRLYYVCVYLFHTGCYSITACISREPQELSEPVYSCFILSYKCFLMMLCFQTNKLDDIYPHFNKTPSLYQLT